MTPFENMTHDELVTFAKRAYLGLIKARGVMLQIRDRDEDSPFWADKGGTGAKAAAVAEAILRGVPTWYDPQNGFERSYFEYYRAASPALFPDAVTPLGEPVYVDWQACDVCDYYFCPWPEQDGCRNCGSRHHHALTLAEVEQPPAQQLSRSQ